MRSAGIAETSGSVKRRFLVFQLAGRVYALPAETVAEVIRVPATARVPQAPRALIGVANLRGAVLPVVSLRALLDLEGEPAPPRVRSSWMAALPSVLWSTLSRGSLQLTPSGSKPDRRNLALNKANN